LEGKLNERNVEQAAGLFYSLLWTLNKLTYVRLPHPLREC